MRYLSGEDGRTPVRRAAAEAAIWEPQCPADATHLEIVLLPFDTTEPDRPIESLPLDKGPIQLVITNSPTRRCFGRPHPARQADIASVHFEMLYDLLAPGTGSSHSTHMTPAERLIPRRPERILRSWSWFRRRTAVSYFPWWPSSERSDLDGPDPKDPLGDVAEAVGIKERPICIPASGNG
jgi:hypothetical protein